MKISDWLILTASLVRIKAISHKKMVCDEDMLSKTQAYLKLFATTKFRLKTGQEVAVRALVEGERMCWHFFLTGYTMVMHGRSLINQMFVGAQGP